MTQTQKRLTIIELAISITDIETINLQTLKLQPLRSDVRIDKILTELKVENYAQAKYLISEYIASPNHTVVQRIPQEELEIIDSFDFLEVKQNNTDISSQTDESMETQTNTQIDTEDDTTVDTTEEANPSQINHSSLDQSFDTLLNIDSNTILEHNIDLNISQEIEKKEKIDFALNEIPKDSYFDTFTPIETQSDKTMTDEESTKEEKIEEFVNSSTDETQEEIENKSHTLFQELLLTYSPLDKKETYSEDLESWIKSIEKQEYTQDDIEKMISKIDTLSQTDKAQAAQFLLATSMTQSNYAQFILARALYKGTLLKRNLDESFRIMSQLSYKEHYPEALCDLGQFYENGIATKKDKKEALLLYQSSMDAGVMRAQIHYERLKKEKSGLFSFFK